MSVRSAFHSQPTFFGLNEKYMKGVYEQLFFLKQHGNWGFVESYNLPNKLRQWWVERLSKHIEEQNKANSKQRRSL
jgi:hypothetical protein